MALYSTVDRRTWMDAKFRSLSADAKLLWFYLLTGPESTSLPGVIVAGRAQLAESLGWELERFGIRYRELSDRGMAKADFDARLVWLPNAIKYRAPANSKVILGWKAIWDNVPECQLKQLIYQHLETHVATRGDAFVHAWNRIAYGIGYGMPFQEQEQEQEQYVSSNEETNTCEPSAKGKSYPVDFETWWQTYPRRVGKQAAWKAWVKSVKRYQQEHACDKQEACDDLLDHTKRFSVSPKAKGKYCPHPATWLNEGRWEDDPATWGAAAPPSASRVATDEDMKRWNPIDGGLGATE
jgi:hypothetical protein